MLLPEGARSSARDYQLIINYTLGAIVGALATAAFLLVVEGIVPDQMEIRNVFAVMTATVLVLWLLQQQSGRQMLPAARRQISSTVFAGSSFRGAARFGFEYGSGVRTYVTSATAYVFVVYIVIGRPSPLSVLWMGVCFGIGRSYYLLVRVVARDRVMASAGLLRVTGVLGSSGATVLLALLFAVQVPT